MTLFSDSASRVDDPYLARALALAERGRGCTWPNPAVGCVIVREDRIVGEGYHQRAGEPHAEVLALQDAGSASLGAAAYVTLEPCAHHGKTPPCAEALIAAGVGRVVIGMRDPNSEASGGAGKLRDAGVAVEFASDPTPFAALNEGWLKRLATGIPFVRAKVALSLDGRPAFESGVRAAITGPSGAEVTRRLRAVADAVAVGARTVAADDPALTVRSADSSLADRQPLRVVFVRDSIPPADARVFSDEVAETLVLDSSDGLPAALRALGERGVGDLLIEPGPRLLSALWTERLLDELVLVQAGGMAGSSAPNLFLGEGDRAGDALVHHMFAQEAGIVGDVAVTVWRPAPDASE